MSIKSWVPWWAKIAGKVALSRLPFAYQLWQNVGLFRHGAMDSAAYSTSVFHTHVQRAGLTATLNGKTILELGPGDSIATALISKAHGARAILIDRADFARLDLTCYLDLAQLLEKLGLAPPQLTDARSLNDVLDACEARYLTDGLNSLKELPSRSVDLVFSHAVLEHVRRAEFLETQIECRRVMRTDAIASHRIDLRDHLGGRLNNLRFSEALWESQFFSFSGFYTNRIQFSEMLDLFSKAGFSVELGEVERWDVLPTSRDKLAEPFRKKRADELCVSGFDVMLRVKVNGEDGNQRKPGTDHV